MARKPDDSIYVARATGVVRIGETEYRYTTGRTRVRAGHPLLKALPGKFRPEAPDTETIAAIPSIDVPRSRRPRAEAPVVETPVLETPAEVAVPTVEDVAPVIELD